MGRVRETPRWLGAIGGFGRLKKVLIDTDPGTDDALAIMMALGSKPDPVRESTRHPAAKKSNHEMMAAPQEVKAATDQSSKEVADDKGTSSGDLIGGRDVAEDDPDSAKRLVQISEPGSAKLSASADLKFPSWHDAIQRMRDIVRLTHDESGS